ncbi:MAG: SNF2-related protein, partial [Bacteroidota bacterium]
MATLSEKAPARRKPAARSKAKAIKDDKIPFYRQPEDLTLERWQAGLRKQFGKDSAFIMENLGEHSVFSDFNVRNPETKNTYRVAIRSLGDSGNFCSCMDFKTNRLGVCKHIGFVLDRLSKKRGYKGIIKKGFHQTHSSIYLDYRNGRKIRLSIGSENEAEFRQLAEKYFDADLAILPESFPVFEKILEEARRLYEGFRCYDDALEFVLAQREMLRRNARLDQIFPQGIESEAFDNLLKIKLYPYQKQGVLFAARAGRCLLADEMGLGKTVQAIAAAELFRKEFGAARVLVVCPTSLKYQWKSEIERFSDLTAHVVEGGLPSRKKQYRELGDFFTIAGYQTVANDLHDLNALEFDLILLDEAQRIKNWATKTSAAIKKLRSPHAIVLTGTPLENKLEELYSIVQFIDQFRLGPLYSFLNRYLVKNENGKVVGFRHLKEISVSLADLMLRRTKKQVLKELPKRQDKTLLVPMTQEQWAMHNGLKEEVAKLVAKWQR